MEKEGGQEFSLAAPHNSTIIHVLGTEDEGAKNQATNASSPWANTTYQMGHCKDGEKYRFQHDPAI